MPSDISRGTGETRHSQSREYFAFLPKRMKDGKWIWLRTYKRGRSLFD